MCCRRSTSRRAIGSMPSSMRRSSASAENRRRATGKPERMQQRAGQDGVGQRVGRRLEARAVAIQRRDRAPQRVGRDGQLRRDLLHQLRRAQLPHRLLRVARSQDLVVLLEQPRRRAARDLVAMDGDRVEDRLIDRELEPRRRGRRRAACGPDLRGTARPGSPMQRISRASRSVEAADVVDDREGADVVEERVDGEVAAEGVLFRRAVGVVAMNQPVVRATAVAGAPASPLGVGPLLVGASATVVSVTGLRPRPRALRRSRLRRSAPSNRPGGGTSRPRSSACRT